MKLGAGFAVGCALAAFFAWPTSSAAQAITSDGTLGTVVGNGGDAYTITGGTQRGNNLFHSFGQFSVPTLGSATFDGPASTANVLSRVTGGVSSSIDGSISTRAGLSPMPSANFFLINPAGVMFGPNASIDVGGAFRVSTADNIRLADGVLFSATAGLSDALLSSAPPQAFGFLSSSPAPIDVNGAVLAVDPPADPSEPGQTLSLVGGDVTVRGGAFLLAPGGLVQVVGVGSPGNVNFPSTDLGLGSFSRLGRVTISEGSGISAGGIFFDLQILGGAVVIRGGEIIIEGGSIVTTDTSDFGGAAVGIDLAATDSVIVKEASSVLTFSTGSSDASGIAISGGNLTVTDVGTTIETQGGGGNGGAVDIQVANAEVLAGGKVRTTSNSNGGNITMAASGTLMVSGADSEISTGTFLTSDPAVFGGDITISAGDLVLRDRGLIRSGSEIEQAGRRIQVTANALSISGLAGIAGRAFQGAAGAIDITTPRLVMEAGFINISTLGTGDAGQIAINANTFSLTNGAQIASSSQNVATGAGGAITINAPGSVAISGTGAADGVGSITLTGSQSSGLFSTTEAAGNAGQIAISTPTLTLTNGGTISVATNGAGDAGSISANVANFNVAGGSRIDSSTTAGGAGGGITVSASNVSISGTDTGLFSTASSTGGAGQIAVLGSNVAITGGGRVDSSTTAGGAGGGIEVNASNVSISGTDSGLFSTASSTGSAGQIAVSGSNVAVTSGGRMDSSTTGAGAGGAISVSAVSQVEISSGGSVRADSLGAGNTGSIAIAAGDRIIMESGSISTRAVTSDGGNITLMAPNIIRLGNSQITTSVQSGTGAGGNIFIDPQFVILTNSTISANAFGGPGGNITIVANNFLADPSTSIVASSALSTPGTVQIQSPDNNVASDIAQLPRELVDASRLLRGGCSARRTGAPSSFTVAGRGGVPVDPDGYLPSFSVSGAPSAGVRGAAADQGFALAMAGGDCWR